VAKSWEKLYLDASDIIGSIDKTLTDTRRQLHQAEFDRDKYKNLLTRVLVQEGNCTVKLLAEIRNEIFNKEK